MVVLTARRMVVGRDLYRTRSEVWNGIHGCAVTTSSSGLPAQCPQDNILRGSNPLTTVRSVMVQEAAQTSNFCVSHALQERIDNLFCIQLTNVVGRLVTKNTLNRRAARPQSRSSRVSGLSKRKNSGTVLNKYLLVRADVRR